ncbi:Copia protein, partial [Mucuna pruriens]
MQKELDQFQKNDIWKLVSLSNDKSIIEFEIRMVGELKFFLKLQIKQAEDRIYIHQTKYIKELLKKFNLEDCKIRSTPIHPKSILNIEETDKMKSTLDLKFINTENQLADLQNPFREDKLINIRNLLVMTLIKK